MSSYIMTPESLLRIAHTLSDLLYAAEHGTDSCLCFTAAAEASLPLVFREHYDRRRKSYNTAGIANDLYALNCKAYSSRYKTPHTVPAPLPLFDLDNSLYQPTEYRQGPYGMIEAPRPWHYHLLKLLDCYLYQTDEDTVKADPLRAALQKFSTALMGAIIHHTPAYMQISWGA